jgi:hypothetical protein
MDADVAELDLPIRLASYHPDIDSVTIAACSINGRFRDVGIGEEIFDGHIKGAHAFLPKKRAAEAALS